LRLECAPDSKVCVSPPARRLVLRMRPIPKPNALRIARERAGLTRELLAVRAGISFSTLCLAERAGLISPTTAEKVGLVLGVEPATLRDGAA
jgi:DNA-binding XRE family transcriptional regulator